MIMKKKTKLIRLLPFWQVISMVRSPTITRFYCSPHLRSFRNFYFAKYSEYPTTSFSVGNSNGHQKQTRIDFVIAAMKAFAIVE